MAALAQNHQLGRTRGARQHPGAELNRRPRVPAGVQQRHRRAVALGRGVREPQVGGEEAQRDPGGASARVDGAQVRQRAVAAHLPQVRHGAHRYHGARQPSAGECRQRPTQDAQCSRARHVRPGAPVTRVEQARGGHRRHVRRAGRHLVGEKTADAGSQKYQGTVVVLGLDEADEEVDPGVVTHSRGIR